MKQSTTKKSRKGVQSEKDLATTSERNTLLKKSAGAIHIFAELTFLQRKMMNVLLYNAFEDLLTEKSHSISVETLCMLVGFDSKNHSYLKSSIRGLANQLIEWNVLDSKGSEVWGVSTLLASVEIQDGIVSYEYSSKLAEKLYNPKSYAKINLAIQRKMTSGTAYALYELGFRYLKVGQTPWMPLDVFKRLIGVEGSKNYNEFFQFNAKVIKPNIKTVNETTDITMEAVFSKTGRKVSDIQLRVKPNSQLTMIGMEEEDIINQTEAYKRCLKRGIPKILARQWIVDHGEEYVIEKLDHTDKMEGAGRIQSTASGFLTKAVEQDYKTEEVHQKKLRKEVDDKRQERREREKDLDRLSSQLRTVERSYRTGILDRINARYSELPDHEKQQTTNEFLGSLEGNSIAIDRFRKDGWSSVLSYQKIREFWADKYSLPFPAIAEFAKENGIPDLEAHKKRIETLEKELN